MGLYEKYELLALLRDDGVKTFVARDQVTGRAVEAHLLTGSASESRTLLDRIDRLSPEERRYILECGVHEGTPYVIADLLPKRQGLKQWLDGVTRASSDEEFLQLFQATPVLSDNDFVQMFQEPPARPEESGSGAEGNPLHLFLGILVAFLLIAAFVIVFR
jgi:hypothetical protein